MIKTRKLFGKPFADRGHISQNLFEMLFVDDIHLVTKIKKNMKNSLMNLYDKLMLRKRSVIETVNDELKNVCQLSIPDTAPSTTLPQTCSPDLLPTTCCQRSLK